jgi:hypothetical protein
MLTIVLAASVVPARSGNIHSSAVSRGMVCDASAHRLSPSSSPTLIHNTSPSMRSIRTTTALPIGHKPRSQETTSTPPVCLSSVTLTSVSMLSEVRRVLVDWLRRYTTQLHILFAGFGIAYKHRPGVGPFFLQVCILSCRAVHHAGIMKCIKGSTGLENMRAASGCHG